MVQARSHEFGVVPPDVVGGEHGVEQRHVRCVGGNAGVQQGVVPEGAVGADPQALDRFEGFVDEPGQLPDVALVDGVRPSEPVGQLVVIGLEAVGQGGQGLGRGHVGHGGLVDEWTLLVDVERGRQIEDGLAVLDGHDSPGRERAPVADAVHLVQDRRVGVAGPKEIRVQRVDVAALDGPARRHQRLGGHLASEHPLPVLVGADPTEDVDLDGLDIEELDEEIEGVAHDPIFAGGHKEQAVRPWG